MTVRMFLAAFLSVAAFGADAASAILIRHDREDAKYRALGDRYAAVGRLGRAGAGTLVAASWVITAAHVAVGMRRDTPFEIGGEAYPIVARVPHPRWTEMGPHDIALVQLERPVTGITSMALYAGRDEEGKDVVFVGFGGTGTGLSGPRSEEDGAKRGATNRVDRATENWIEFTFDAPPGGTDLEGISGPGDSGGPDHRGQQRTARGGGQHLGPARREGSRDLRCARGLHPGVELRHVDWRNTAYSGQELRKVRRI